ncbi:hypothetical protein QTG56_24360 (plasmid) [Rossellomorea sp. AcN35-11]|nr:hypothetical protein [Rossellomorea aquimaris]WJV31769.1 hypothetical protein QTG56_24360 [Rossellomorea sp. AcN35-11]
MKRYNGEVFVVIALLFFSLCLLLTIGITGIFILFVLLLIYLGYRWWIKEDDNGHSEAEGDTQLAQGYGCMWVIVIIIIFYAISK